MLLQHLHQARFANARFTAEQYYLSEAILDLRPTLQQESHFLLPAHERGPAGTPSGFQATAGHAFIEYAVDRQRLGLAFQRWGPQRLAGKEPPEELKGGGTNDQRIGRRNALQARRQVGGLTECQLLLPSASAYLPHNDQAGMDAQAHG